MYPPAACTQLNGMIEFQDDHHRSHWQAVIGNARDLPAEAVRNCLQLTPYTENMVKMQPLASPVILCLTRFNAVLLPVFCKTFVWTWDIHSGWSMSR